MHTSFLCCCCLACPGLALSLPLLLAYRSCSQGVDQQISQFAKRILPNLEPLAPRLKALSLANNRCTRLPDCLIKLTSLEVLDLNGEGQQHVQGLGQRTQ